MTAQIYLLASDVDGTLVNKKKQLTPRTVKAIENVQATGCEVVIATGRAWSELEELRAKLPKIHYYICSNGAYVRDTRSDTVIYHETFANQTGVALLRALDREDVYLEVYMGEAVYGDTKNLSRMDAFINKKLQPLIRESRTFVDNLIDFVEKSGKGLEKVQVFYGTDAKSTKIMKQYGDNKEFTLIRSSEGNLEFTKPTISKGKALQALAEHRGLIPEAVMAIGDSNNDLPMLAYAGVSYAMANGEDTTKAVAKFLAPDNDADGVAQVLENLVTEGRLGHG